VGFDGWVQLAIVESVPINVLEPGVILDILSVATKAAKSLCWVNYAELGDEVFGVGGHARGVFDFAFNDSVQEFLA